MTDALAKTLASKGIQSEIYLPDSTLQYALDDAARRGFTYVLKGKITKWEDHLGSDTASLSLELYEASSREMVASMHFVSGSGRTRNRATTEPADLIPELAEPFARENLQRGHVPEIHPSLVPEKRLERARVRTCTFLVLNPIAI